MDPAQYAALTGGTLALLGILTASARAFKLLHVQLIRLERIELLSRELAPNSGGSIKDTVHRVERKVDDRLGRLEQQVEHLEGSIDQKLEGYRDRLARAEGRIEAIALVTSPTMLIEDEGGVLRETRAKRD